MTTTFKANPLSLVGLLMLFLRGLSLRLLPFVDLSRCGKMRTILAEGAASTAIYGIGLTKWRGCDVGHQHANSRLLLRQQKRPIHQ
jgi:hypothetical protein